MRPDVSEEEAIRTVFHEGKCADYVDIANEVQKRFGLRIGAARVEEVVHAMKQKTPDQPLARLHHADVSLAGNLHHETQKGSHKPGPVKASADAASARDEVLKFVESMGGFDAARTAIDNLERSLKDLMK